MTQPPDDQPDGLRDCEPATEPNVQPTHAPTSPKLGSPAGLATHLPMWRLVATLAMWPLLEQLVGATVWFVDSALAGHLAEAVVEPASNAIGAAAYILWLMGIIQGAAGVGATAAIARDVGAGDYDKADVTVGQAMLVAVIWGLINLVLFIAIAPHVGWLISLEPAAVAMAGEYITIVALVAPLRAMLFIGSACLRGAGDTRSPFYVGLVVNVVNIAISVSLIAGLNPDDEWAVRYIAIGTAVGWSVGGVLMIALLLRGRGGVRLHPSLMKPVRAVIVRLLKVGVPALIENVAHWSGNFLVMILVGQLAARKLEQNPVAIHNFAIRIEGLSFLPGFAFSIAAATLAGQYLGAGDPVRARRAVNWAWLYGAGLMSAMGVLFILVPDWFAWVVTDQPHLADRTAELLFIAGFAQAGFGTAMVFGGALRGAGDTRATMWITFGSTFLVRLPAAYLIGIHLEYGLNGLWVALSSELILRGVFVTARYLHGGWTRVRV